MTPRSLFIVVVLALAAPGRADDGAVPAGGPPPEAPPAVEWLPAYYEGFAKARREGRPICLYFAACWSPSCRALEEAAFGDPAVREALEPYACVRVDVDGDFLTPGRFGVRRVPGFLLLDRDEKPLVEVPLKEASAASLAEAFRKGYEEFLKRP